MKKLMKIVIIITIAIILITALIGTFTGINEARDVLTSSNEFEDKVIGIMK